MILSEHLVFSGEELISTQQEAILQQLNFTQENSEGQIQAWIETIRILKELIGSNSQLKEAQFVFEYELPLFDGKRPDILMFVKNSLYIIEFKNRGSFGAEDIAQVSSYLDLFGNYHSYSSYYRLKAILLINSSEDFVQSEESIRIVTASRFISEWSELKDVNLKPTYSAEWFVSGRYKVSSDLMKYATELFNSSDQLKGIEYPSLQESTLTFRTIEEIINKSRVNKTHTLILVSGEAGSGKSALALRTMHDFQGSYVVKNPKIIDLLKIHLKGQPNIHSATSVIREFLNAGRTLCSNVVVIDEAQRTWDNRRIREYYNADISEYEILLSHKLHCKEWSCTIAFIGVEQQLGKSETSDYNNWFYAFADLEIPEHRKEIFYSPELIEIIPKNVVSHPVDSLHLSTNLRSNLTFNYSQLVKDIIESPCLEDIPERVKACQKQGFMLRITRDLDKAIDYVQRLNLSSALLGMANEDTPNPPLQISHQGSKQASAEILLSKKTSECYKANPLTQFHVLGLECDLPIIVWNGSYLYYRESWNYDIEIKIFGKGLFYVRNAYKVFLTRGREGMVLFFPPSWEFNRTYDYFQSIGFQSL